MLPISQRFTVILFQYLTPDAFVNLCFTILVKNIMSKHVHHNPMGMKITNTMTGLVTVIVMTITVTNSNSHSMAIVSINGYIYLYLAVI